MNRQAAPKTRGTSTLSAVTAIASLVAALGLAACERVAERDMAAGPLPTEAELIVAKS